MNTSYLRLATFHVSRLWPPVQVRLKSMKDGYSLLAFAICCAVFMQGNYAFAQSWMITGAPSEDWTSVASSADGSKLIAVCSGGRIYTSTNSGADWNTSSAPSLDWSSVACSQDARNVVVVSGSGSIYTSTNSGENWIGASAPSSNWVAVACSADGADVVAVVRYGFIYRSTDFGNSWTMTSAPNERWTSIASSADGIHLVATAGPGFIYTSSDKGVTWMQSTAPVEFWFSVASSADGTNLLAVAAWDEIYAGGIYRSKDNGATWTVIDAPPAEWTSAACSADGVSLVAEAYTGLLYTSTNSGIDWIQTSVPGSSWTASIASSADGNHFVACQGQIFTSPPASPLAISCSIPAIAECGYPWSVPVLVSSASNDALTVVWTLNGIAVQTNSELQGDLPTPIDAGQWWYGLPLGTNVFEFTVTDTAGNVASNSAIVTVVDTRAPILFPPPNLSVEFSNEAGATVSFDLGTAADTCSGEVPIIGVPPSGSTFPIGTNDVMCAATDDSGNTSTNHFSIIVAGARGVKENVRGEMIDSNSIQTSLPIDHSIKDLSEALTSSLWADETHLVPGAGEKVFSADARAISALRRLLEQKNSDVADTTVQDWINRLIKADRLLASLEVEAAANAGAQQRSVANASKELASGDQLVTHEKYVAAVLHYRESWILASDLLR